VRDQLDRIGEAVACGVEVESTRADVFPQVEPARPVVEAGRPDGRGEFGEAPSALGDVGAACASVQTRGRGRQDIGGRSWLVASTGSLQRNPGVDSRSWLLPSVGGRVADLITVR
jgi:hypothetical protein